MSSTLKTALSGLNDSALRILTSSRNIANAMTTSRLPASEDEPSTGYTPQDVISLSDSFGDEKFGVRSNVINRQPAYYPAPDPRSPFANEQGLVAAPNVDIAAELVKTKLASTAYKANAAVIRVTLENDNHLLDILE